MKRDSRAMDNGDEAFINANEREEERRKKAHNTFKFGLMSKTGQPGDMFSKYANSL